MVNHALRTGSRAALRAAILSYLEKNPNASDTPAGICAWWLPAEGVTGSVDVVEEVLESLTERQLLRQIELPDGSVIYGANSRNGDQ